MAKRIRWRVLLPVLNLLLFGTLAIVGARPRLLAAILQESTNVPWTVENPFYPLESAPRLVAVALNAPAYLCAALILTAARVSNERFADAVLILMPPFVLVIWYYTGRWFDRRTGNLPLVTQPPSRLHWLTLAAAVMGVALFGCLYRAVYFLRGGIAGWHGETRFVAATSYGLAAWAVLWEVMLIAAAIRCSKQAGRNC